MLYEKYSTAFDFDPPTQNSLYIHIVSFGEFEGLQVAKKILD